ncbi:MAG: DUF87 domain-containing protein [Pseudomonadota bacterium]
MKHNQLNQQNSLFPAVVVLMEDGKLRVSSAMRLNALQSIKLEKKDNKEDSKTETRYNSLFLHSQILQALAAWPTHLTVTLNLLTVPVAAFPLGGKVQIAIVLTAHGTEQKQLIAELLSRFANLFALLGSYYKEAEFEMITNFQELRKWVRPFRPTTVAMIDRIQETYTLAKPQKNSKSPLAVGFLSSANRIETVPNEDKTSTIDYLFPWHQDPYADLANVLEALLYHPSAIWFQIRLRSALVGEDEKQKLEEDLTHCAELLSNKYPPESVLFIQTQALRQAISERIWQLNRPVFQGGCFLCSESTMDETLINAIANEIASRPDVKEEPYLPLKGGFSITRLAPENFLKPDYFSKHIFTVEEAACAFRIPHGRHKDPHGLPIKRYRTGLIAPSLLSNDQRELLLGINRHSGHVNEVRIADEDRMRHMAIMGMTGVGKSVFLESLVLQDIVQGKGCCFIDPHGDSVEKILHLYPEERIDDLVLIDYLDRDQIIPFNILRYNDSEERDRIIDDIYNWCDETYNLRETGGPMFEIYYRSFMRLLMGEMPRTDFQPIMADFMRLFIDEKFRNYCLSQCQSTDVRRMLRQAKAATGDASLSAVAPYITSKVNRFFASEAMQLLMGQESLALDFPTIMDQGKVVLVNLGRGRFGQTTTGFLASQIVSRLQSAAMQRINIPAEERRDFYLYIDEFQTVASDSFISMLSQARKFKLGLVIANQYADQLDKRSLISGDSVLKAILGNVGATVCFRLGVNDAKTMEDVFRPDFKEQDLSNLPVGNCYVNLKARSKNPCSFSMETSYLKWESRPEHVAKLRKSSNHHYAVSLEEAKRNLQLHNEELDALCDYSRTTSEHSWK